ncbi:hypothetical protein ASF71_18805 [Deinococcus sp. Leaf326]|nr:hypothetical protein ASF71_18805 [Deinococcus sp. Leaf326]
MAGGQTGATDLFETSGQGSVSVHGSLGIVLFEDLPNEETLTDIRTAVLGHTEDSKPFIGGVIG